MKVRASAIIFKRKTAIILDFANISEQKAQIQIMSSHNRELTNFVDKFKKKIEKSLLTC